MSLVRAVPSIGLLPHLANQIILGPQDNRTIAIENPANGNYGRGKAELLAKAAQLAYDDSRALSRVPGALKRQTGFDVVEFSPIVAKKEDTDIQAFVAAGEQMVLCVFRGTEPLNLVDWALDFDVVPAEVPLPLSRGRKVHIHEGFWRGVNAVWDKHLLPALQNALAGSTGRFLYFAGHSLGGALAMVAAARAPEDVLDRVRGVYTMGQPRVGFADFAEAYDRVLLERTFRLANGEDIVPSVPLQAMDYVHSGLEVECRVGPDVMLHLDWGRRCAVRMLHDSVYRLFPPAIEDHFPEAYVRGARAVV